MLKYAYRGSNFVSCRFSVERCSFAPFQAQKSIIIVYVFYPEVKIYGK